MLTLSFFFFFFCAMGHGLFRSRHIRELTNRRLSHDDTVGLRGIPTAHACLGTCRRRVKVSGVGKSHLPAS